MRLGCNCNSLLNFWCEFSDSCLFFIAAGFEERFQKESSLCSSAIRPSLVKVTTMFDFVTDALQCGLNNA